LAQQFADWKGTAVLLPLKQTMGQLIREEVASANVPFSAFTENEV
jgi:hypothetical protein